MEELPNSQTLLTSDLLGISETRYERNYRVSWVIPLIPGFLSGSLYSDLQITEGKHTPLLNWY